MSGARLRLHTVHGFYLKPMIPLLYSIQFLARSDFKILVPCFDTQTNHIYSHTT